MSVHCFNLTVSTRRDECLTLQVQEKIQPAMNKTLSKYQDGKIHILVHQLWALFTKNIARFIGCSSECCKTMVSDIRNGPYL